MSPVFNSLLLILLTTGISLASENIKIRNARINEAPPTVRVHAGYLDIINDNAETIDLIGASSPVFEKIEFHATTIDQGVASMHRQETIPVPAQSTFSFSPGRYHLMLFNSNTPLHAGDIIPLELVFSGGESIHTDMHVTHVEPGESHHH